MRTLTLKQAYALATPGPFVLPDGPAPDIKDQAQLLTDNAGTEMEWECIGKNDEDGFAEVVALAHPCNAALLAHAYNMLPEVLATMGRLQAIVESEFPVSDERYQTAIKADELFIKANIVTIPESRLPTEKDTNET